MKQEDVCLYAVVVGTQGGMTSQPNVFSAWSPPVAVLQEVLEPSSGGTWLDEVEPRGCVLEP